MTSTGNSWSSSWVAITLKMAVLPLRVLSLKAITGNIEPFVKNSFNADQLKSLRK